MGLVFIVLFWVFPRKQSKILSSTFSQVCKWPFHQKVNLPFSVRVIDGFYHSTSFLPVTSKKSSLFYYIHPMPQSDHSPVTGSWRSPVLLLLLFLRMTHHFVFIRPLIYFMSFKGNQHFQVSSDIEEAKWF